MSKQQVLLTLASVILVTAFLYCAPQIINSSQSSNESVSCVARSTIVARGQDWVDKHVPYSQSGTHDGYRTDCSGFVSMCWQLSKPGLTTSTLKGASHSIAKTDLQPGDAIICQGTHVVLFVGWSDSSKTHYTSMQQANTQTGTVKRVTPYPYWNDASCYHPIRSNTVC